MTIPVELAMIAMSCGSIGGFVAGYLARGTHRDPLEDL